MISLKGTFYTYALSRCEKLSTKPGKHLVGTHLVPQKLPANVYWTLHLAPSQFLFNAAKDLQYSGNWNNETFHSFYKPELLFLLTRYDAQQELQKIYAYLEAGLDVYFYCYCQAHFMCHRSLVAQVVAEAGYSVIIR